ncbi:MAG TPA: carboxypeptidase-like regulatory domain-containing protein [Sphingobacteriaceae bacterium]|nr:carboxypeptidase-like regulatory domain-containing protein [Sphingobacteriaceae bacterium]
MKKLLLISCIFYLFAGHLLAQDKQVQGIVFDSYNKQRINRVYIYNTRTEKGIYNNTKGEFAISGASGDVLVIALQGYLVDTVKINTQNTILIYLKRNSIQLKEVIVRDSTKSPGDQLKATKEEYDVAYKRGNTKDIFSTGGSNGAGGAGLSIDALYNLISKSGRDSRQLQKVIERDYREALISYRYNRIFVSGITNLNGIQLTDFIQQYRPSYNFTMEASDYEMVRFIKLSHQRYLQNPAAYRLPPLKSAN